MSIPGRPCKVCKIQICSQPEEVCWSCLYSKFGRGDISETPITKDISTASNFPRTSIERKYFTRPNENEDADSMYVKRRTIKDTPTTTVELRAGKNDHKSGMSNPNVRDQSLEPNRQSDNGGENNKRAAHYGTLRSTQTSERDITELPATLQETQISELPVCGSRTGNDELKSDREKQHFKLNRTSLTEMFIKLEKKYDKHSVTQVYTRQSNELVGEASCVGDGGSGKVLRNKEAFAEDVKELIENVCHSQSSDQFYDGIAIVFPHNDRQKLDISQRYEDMPIFKKPEILIYTDESNKLAIREEALGQISSIAYPLNIVAINGHYRTGKSYLMNQLANEKNGFAIGHKVSSETKGIWAWCKPHPTQKDQVLLLLDVEGMADVNKGDREHDNRLFCLSTLLSSTVIYNHKGVFDQDALEKMSASHDLSGEAIDETIRLLSPTFVICLRDFYLHLEDDSEEFQDADAYFEKVIDISSGPEKTSNYDTKECIHKFFPKRKCLTFSQPAMNRKLMKLNMLDDTELEKEFLDDVDNLKKFVYECKPKVLDAVTKKETHGPVFETFLRTYVRALADGDIMTYTEAFQKASELHNGTLAMKVVYEYQEEVDKIEIPVRRKQEIQQHCMKIQKRKLEKFRNESYPLRKHLFEESIMEKMATIQTKKMEENGEKVQSVLFDLLRQIHREIIEKRKENYDSKHGLSLFKKDVKLVKNTFEEKTKSYDNDDVSTVFLRYKKTEIYDEKMRVEIAAEVRKEEIRNEELQKQMKETLQLQLGKEIEEIKREKASALDKELREMKHNYIEAMGKEAVKGQPFWKKIKLLFGN